jgi:hypothetical protein
MSRALTRGTCAPGSNQRGTCWLFEFHSFAPVAYSRREGLPVRKFDCVPLGTSSLPDCSGFGPSFFGALIF